MSMLCLYYLINISSSRNCLINIVIVKYVFERPKLIWDQKSLPIINSICSDQCQCIALDWI